MEKKFVTVKGKKYYIKGDKLDLSQKEITDIAEIKGLDNLTNLKKLDLSWNQIEEIKGLENLTQLEMLKLDNNEIKEIKGLGNLTNLQKITLHNNLIRLPESRLIRLSAQEVVKYCQDKARKEKEEDEMEEETFESAFDAWRSERDLERYFDINLHASDFDIDEDWGMYKLDEGISIGLFIFMEDIFREELRGNKLSQHELIERINEWLRPYLTRG